MIIKSIVFKKKFIYMKGTFRYKGKTKKWEHKIPINSVMECNRTAVSDPVEEIGYKEEIFRKATNTFILKYLEVVLRKNWNLILINGYKKRKKLILFQLIKLKLYGMD